MPRAEIKKKAGKKKVKSAQAPSVKIDQGKKRTALKASGKAPEKLSPPAKKTKSTAKSYAKSRTAKKAGPPSLPEEYGENDLFLIAVDPDIVYASWEIKRDNMPRRGGIKMRFVDVTAGEGAGTFLDVALSERIGSGFFEIRMYGREIVAAIGNARGGRFVPIIRSHRVSIPETSFAGEPEAGLPIGY